jgi:hypothetical protein
MRPRGRADATKRKPENEKKPNQKRKTKRPEPKKQKTKTTSRHDINRPRNPKQEQHRTPSQRTRQKQTLQQAKPTKHQANGHHNPNQQPGFGTNPREEPKNRRRKQPNHPTA